VARDEFDFVPLLQGSRAVFGPDAEKAKKNLFGHGLTLMHTDKEILSLPRIA